MNKLTLKLALAYAIGPFIIGFSSRKLSTDISNLMFFSGGGLFGSMMLFITVSSFLIFLNPSLGYLSDRTKTRFGRRKPYIFGSLMVLTIISLLTSISPYNLGILDLQITWVYSSILFIAFNLISILFSLNVKSLFPEMFQNLRDRTTAYGFYLAMLNMGIIVSYLIEAFQDQIDLVLG